MVFSSTVPKVKKKVHSEKVGFSLNPIIFKNCLHKQARRLDSFDRRKHCLKTNPKVFFFCFSLNCIHTTSFFLFLSWYFVTNFEKVKHSFVSFRKMVHHDLLKNKKQKTFQTFVYNKPFRGSLVTFPEKEMAYDQTAQDFIKWFTY